MAFKVKDRYVPTSMLKKDSDEYKMRREEFAENQANKVVTPYKVPKEVKDTINKVDKQDYDGYKIGDLRKTFTKYQNKENWKKPVDAYVMTKEEADKLSTAITYFQADVAKVEEVSMPVRHKEGLVYMEGKAFHVKSRGYQAD